MRKPIYLDYNATTPIDPFVADEIIPYILTDFGNPSSSHTYGSAARNAVEKARRQVAELLSCSPSEVIFTSGGTESNNLAIKGYARAHRKNGKHIITSEIEHPAVLEVCSALEKEGFEITVLPVDHAGRVALEAVEEAIRKDTILISIMHSNNEVGTLQPIAEIAKIAHSHNIVMHTDASQSIGKVPVDAKRTGADLLTVAGHKLYAPKGVGVLYVRDGITLEKQKHGAAHEKGLRAGTENVIGIVGLGAACALISKYLEKYMRQYAETRDQLEHLITQSGVAMRINGDLSKRLPNTSSISFKGLKANEVIAGLEGLAVSAGAACHAENVRISHVLRAMEVPAVYAMGTVRFSTGRGTTREEIAIAADEVIRTVKNL